jgi:hypothetical protein
MRARKRSGALKVDGVVAIASHATMGIALGLVFTLILFSIPLFGVIELIDHSMDPAGTMAVFVGTVATMFGIGAALTGAILMMEDG